MFMIILVDNYYKERCDTPPPNPQDITVHSANCAAFLDSQHHDVEE